MTETPIDLKSSKGRGQIILEYVLLALCLCVIALRTTLTEGPTSPSTNMPINITSSVYSLSISAVLIFAFILWFVLSFCRKRFSYRFTGMEFGLCLFVIAAVIASIAASDKRAAITDFAVFIGPLLCAVLLVQILDSRSKVKLVLTVIAALGVVSAYRCAEQFFVSNQVMIEQYQEAPGTILEPLGIRPNTLAHILLEHRLYSKDVRGFFTTSNSAGSFAILASFASIALFIEKFKNRKSDRSAFLSLVTCGIAAAIIIFGLIITQSKGAIVASLIAAAMFITYLLFGNRLKAHKKIILIVCLLLIIGGGCVVVLYGLAHDRLPGGNSMLVRWQYWHSTVRMYADHWLAGVGPGNFAHFYTHYKPASAPETVADPHNFLLGILTRYGPLGLVGFLTLVLVPLYRAVFPSVAGPSLRARQPEAVFRRLAVTFVIVISAVLLVVRPIIIPVTAGDTFGVMVYVVFTLYIAPVAAFAVGVWLLTAADNTRFTMRNTNITVAALFCAVIGCLIHNLIDFAIFEPGVFTCFWVIVACLIALDFRANGRRQLVLKPATFAKVLMAAGGLILISVYLSCVLIPVTRSTAKIRLARRAASEGRFEQAHKLLDTAAEDDRLSPAALSLNGRMYLQRFLFSTPKQMGLLLHSEKSLRGAIERNRADFKNFERLTNVYTRLAENSERQVKGDWLNKAFDSCLLAAEYYPGCGRVRVELAGIAEQLGRTEYAIEQYKKAVDIEDSYRCQFRVMFPERELFSRLGEEKYRLAKQRIKHLSE